MIIWLLVRMRGILTRLHLSFTSTRMHVNPVALAERSLRSKTVRTEPTARSLAGTRDYSA